MLFSLCEFCGRKRLRVLMKQYPSFWDQWKVYRFCNRECAEKFLERNREEALSRWHQLCKSMPKEAK